LGNIPHQVDDVVDISPHPRNESIQLYPGERQVPFQSNVAAQFENVGSLAAVHATIPVTHQFRLALVEK
jgi:hypothetical protein